MSLANQKILNRRPTNPMDKCTIVSIYPRLVIEKKLTTAPNVFRIPAGSLAAPGVLVVGPASWWKDQDVDNPNMLEITHGSVEMAEAIIVDYCKGLDGFARGTSMPGLFWVPGEYTSAEILKKPEFKVLLQKAELMQKSYYQTLIREADGYWARTSGNPLGISDDMRLAAKELGIQGKDWMSNFSMMENIRCLACGNPRNPNFPVCPTCKAVVDPELATKLGLKFAV